MISCKHEQWNHWRRQLADRVTRPGELAGLLPGFQVTPEMEAAADACPMAITPYYLSLAREPWECDPIIRMAVPSAAELDLHQGRGVDFTGEEKESPLPGLIHRYRDRVLLLVARHCPVLCRFCMRRRIFGKGAGFDDERLAAWAEYIGKDTGIREVILSGGDPLVLGNDRLGAVLEAICAIPHVEMVRIGTRVPVTLPMRVDDELCRLLERFHPLWLVTHFNHPREVTAETAAAVERLTRAGIPVDNQSVLLRGINDDAETMERLLRRLGRIRVHPLYLHQCDPVAGIEHFRTPLAAGPALIDELRPRLGGTLLPRLMVDLPHGGGKVPLHGRRQLRDLQGRSVRNYPGDPE